MNKLPALLVLSCLSPLASLTAQQIRGVIRDANTLRPIADATVFVEDSSHTAVSDATGVFEVQNVEPGRHQLMIRHLQYYARTVPVLLGSAKDIMVDIHMEPRITMLDEVTISAVTRLPPRDMYLIREEETRLYPGTFFDPARVAASFPGVQVPNDQANQLIIDGLHPDFMKWQIEGLEIVNPNHLSNAGTLADRPTLTGGGVNMLSNQMLTNSTLHTGALPIDKGNAISGIMDMHLRDGNAGKHEHTVQLGLLGLDAATEGPFRKGGRVTYLANFRYSTVGLLQELGVDFGDEQIRFYDISAHVHLPTGQRGGSVGIFSIYGASKNNLTPKPEDEWEEERDRSDIRFESTNGILGAVWNAPIGRSSFLRTGVAISAIDYQRTASRAGLPMRYGSESLLSRKLAFNAGLQTNLNSSSQLLAGVNGVFQGHESDFVVGSFTAFDKYLFGSNARMTLIRPYAEWRWTRRMLTARIGMGVGYLIDESSGYPEPLVELELRLPKTHSITFAYRLSTQTPVQYRTTLESINGETLAFVNTSLDLVRAHCAEVTYAKNPAEGMLNVTAFYHHIPDALVGKDGFAMLNLNSLPPNFPLSDNGTGETFGLKAGYRRNFFDNYFLYANISVFESHYTDADGAQRPTTFDGGHTAYAAGGREWTTSRHYGTQTFGANLALIHNGGLKEPMIDPEASRMADRTIYIAGTYGDVKLDNYFRLDVRLYFRKDKASHSSTWSLDIQNLLNRENDWFSYYDLFREEVVQGTQLGLIPVLSYRIDF